MNKKPKKCFVKEGRYRGKKTTEKKNTTSKCSVRSCSGEKKKTQKCSVHEVTGGKRKIFREETLLGKQKQT